jgi:hypothetical protein
MGNRSFEFWCQKAPILAGGIMRKTQNDSKYRWLLAVTIMMALTSVAAWAFDRYVFGSTGYSGSAGQSGYDGRGGADIEIVARGQAENFDLRGGDGGDGSRGSDGSDATSCYQNRGTYNEIGAAGGDGGDGGRAGYGGDGGSVRVYFDNIANLKSVFVDSTPGRAGYPGDGSRAGRGCQCSDRSWERRVCHNEKYYRTVCTPANCNPKETGCTCKREEYWEEVCNRETFYCDDGPDGRDGTTGSRGSDGSYGSISLVGRLEPLESTTPDLSLLVQNAASVTYTLTRHEWDAKGGATSLFANGSRIRNDYSLYAGKTVKTVSFNWNDKQRGVDYYPNQYIGIGLYQRPALVNVDFPSSVLALYSLSVDGDHTTVNVSKTMRPDELVKVRVDEMYGSEESLTLVLLDDANVSDAAKTKIYIKSGWDLEAGHEWKDWVPENLITSEPGKININIGRLPGIKAKKIKKYFGDKCEFEMQVVREFAGRSTQLTNGKYNILDIEKEVKKKKPIQVKWED